ncbi:MAG: Hpt domain-containing protein [Candidatus Omnitrophica bacterium]|nr:Hpt domain-containing protein [Candidatus Omnitrophota bacterium]
MVDWKKHIDRIDQFSLKVNLSDLSSLDDLEKLLYTFFSFRTQPDITSQSLLASVLSEASLVLNALKTQKDKQKSMEELLFSLCSFLKTILSCLDRKEDPLDYIKLLQEKIKFLSTGTEHSQVGQTYFDLHRREIPAFVNPAKELLNNAYNALLVLQKSPADKQKTDELFRVFHTLKGEAKLTGLSSISALAGEAEDFLNTLRSGTTQLGGEAVSVFFKTVERLRKLLEVVSVDPKKASLENVNDAVLNIKDLCIPKFNTTSSSSVFISQPPKLDATLGFDYITDFSAEAFDHLANAEKSILVLETSPGDPEAINNIFRVFHTIKGAARYLNLKDIQTYAHEAETMLDMVRKGALRFEGRVVELSLSSIDGIRKLLTLLQEQASNDGEIKSEYLDIGPSILALKDLIFGNKSQPLGEILCNQGAITDSELQLALKIQQEASDAPKIGDILVATKAASSKQVEEALESQKFGASIGASIRIHLDKLDALMDLVGELVISEAQVMQSPEILAIQKDYFHHNLVELDRITRDLQQLVMGMRLISIAPAFQKMERFVRDFSKAIGKDVLLITHGEDTEIDKNMEELIVDPLMHMVRNSLDHGIESKEERIAQGKSLIGKIELSAFHKGSYVVIEVKDDGVGLRRDKIFNKAVERGLVKKGENLSDNQLFNFIFEPGLSTADTITDVSGRGVGMDIVKKNVDRLQGKINISSQEGKGSVFSMSFPITLAIVEGFIVRAGSDHYILPMNAVVKFVVPKESDRIQIYNKNDMYKYSDKVYPMIHLNDFLGVKDGRSHLEEQTICILDSDSGRACVVVDELLGQQQVVIKSLGKKLTNIKGVSGGAILGDGRVGLILDASSLIEYALKQEGV